MVVPSPKYSWPLPELSDPPDGVGQLTNFGLGVEGTVAASSLVTWAPQWLSTGAPKPANAASLTGRYALSQGWCDFGFTLTMGGATTGGVGGWVFTLPFVANGSLAEQLFYGMLLIPSYAYFPLNGIVNGGGTNLYVYAPQGGLDMRFGPLRQSDGGASSWLPSGPAGPTQPSGRLSFSGRYLVA